MDSKNKDNGSDIHFIGIVGLLFLGIAFQKFKIVFLKWYSNSINQNRVIGAVILILVLILILFIQKYLKFARLNQKEKLIIGDEVDSVYCGKTVNQEIVFIKPRQRSMHTQVIGTTNAGKTESVILPWAIQDIKAGRGLLLIDGKADNSLLNKLWSYSKKFGREKDFRLFSLSHLNFSWQFNPLIGGTAEEITERVFNAFEFENPYYRSIQYEVMGQIMRILMKNKITPTFQNILQLIEDLSLLEKLAIRTSDPMTISWIQKFKGLSASERDSRTSGLASAIGHFVYGKTGVLFNTEKESSTIDQALQKNLIVYFQLPVLLSPFLGKATGKLILQSLQAAVANRHRKRGENHKFFSVFLDDFSEYLYPGFVSVLNKSRSANVGIVFAHQALGDITQLGDSVANAILTNSNLKVFMRGNDPDSAEYFSRMIGTKSSTKYTERQKSGFFNSKQSTGDLSARDVEEFVVHPNIFKRELGVGEAMMIIPHDGGSKTVRIKFDRYPDLTPDVLPIIEKRCLDLIACHKNKYELTEGIADLVINKSEVV